jgi:glycine/D-amino acid oxidase-like deaminating enzyme
LTEKAKTGPLNEDLTVDLVIIGGGYTGCAAALEAARMGASVALLEANDIGHGGSGRNVGLANAGLWLPPETILAQMGEAEGMRLIRALADGPGMVFSIIEREGIECEATRAGTMHLAHAPKGMKGLEDRFRQSSITGATLELLDAEETRRRTGSAAFHGALFDPKAGTVQPLAYCHGLAIAAERAGAKIHTGTKVQSASHDGSHWVVETGKATVRARHMLNATNAYAEAGAKPPAAHSAWVQFSQFATAPLSPEQLERILPGREGCWDTALVMSSLRVDQAGRLIIGGMGDSAGPGGRIHASWAQRKLKSIYPDLGKMEFEYQWSGRIAMTHDHVLKVVAPGRNALSIFGFSGRGISPGTVFGTSAAHALLDGDSDMLPLAVSEGYAEGLAAAKTAYYEFGATAMHAVFMG